MEEKSVSTDEAILNELKQIREHLVPIEEEEVEEKPKKRFHRIRGFGDEFVQFIRKYRVLGLAVAFIMATYVGMLVQSLVDDIIMPILQYIPGLNNLDSLEQWQVGYFFIGSFISTIITFAIISFVMFKIVKIGNKIGLEAE
ncbi:MAG: MscL family protein [Asgard group archaeon]|nr:MscL family protein [Asgard group archaeon]